MDAKEIKQQLSENDILSILSDLGLEPYIENGNIICRTGCHNHDGSGSHKLYYYQDTHMLHCYTNCGSMDLFSLVEKVKGVEFNDAYNYILDYFGFDKSISPNDYYESLDFSFFDRFNKEKEIKELPIVDDKILNLYQDKYHISWINDNIYPSTMKKFNIKLSVAKEQIIIPHYNINGGLVGVRCRNLNPTIVAKGNKYMPVFENNRMYNHPTGANLYGLHENMDNILDMRKLILFESEKSVLQLDSIYGGYGIGVGVSGSSFSDRQLELIKGLDIDEVIIAFDKEFNEVGDPLEKYYAEKIQKTVINKLLPYFSVTVIWDTKGLLKLKDSPTDYGGSVFWELYKKRIAIL